MYFDAKRQKIVVSKLYRSLLDSGWLIVSPCETSRHLFSRFETVNFPGTVLYKKDPSQGDKRQTPLSVDLIKDPAPFPAVKAPVIAGHDFDRNLISSIQSSRSLVRDSRRERPKTDPVMEPVQISYKEAYELYEQGRYTEVITKLASPGSGRP